MSKQNTKLPKWFKGMCYNEGGTVKNPFSGEEYKLNNVELSMYDYVMGATVMAEIGLDVNTEDLHKGLDWFRKNNIDAYMVLLD